MVTRELVKMFGQGSYFKIYFCSRQNTFRILEHDAANKNNFSHLYFPKELIQFFLVGKTHPSLSLSALIQCDQIGRFIGLWAPF